MSELLRRRVQSRLDALGINPFEAERRANLKRGYVNDLLIGKKDTFREKALPSLAAALECDLDFLIGRSDTPRHDPTKAGGMPISGIVEALAWRDLSADNGERQTLPVMPDPRFPPESQEIYLARGDSAAGLGIADGSVVIVLIGDSPYRDGDIVVAKRSANNGTSEISVRVLSGGALSARPAKGEIAAYPAKDAEIIGRVVSAIRVFGAPH